MIRAEARSDRRRWKELADEILGYLMETMQYKRILLPSRKCVTESGVLDSQFILCFTVIFYQIC